MSADCFGVLPCFALDSKAFPFIDTPLHRKVALSPTIETPEMMHNIRVQLPTTCVDDEQTATFANLLQSFDNSGKAFKLSSGCPPTVRALSSCCSKVTNRHPASFDLRYSLTSTCRFCQLVAD
jgi:hypothetical protein